MTVLNRDLFDVESQPKAMPRWLTQWPIALCIFIAVMFMLATNDTSAVVKWQEGGKDPASQLTIVADGSRIVRQAAFILLGAWGLASLLWPARRIRTVPTLLFPLVILVGWITASVLWSDEPSFTAKRLVVFVCFTMAVFAFARRYRPRDLAALMLVGCTIQMVASVIADLMWATGKYGLSGYRLSGLQHPNHTGINSVFLCFACLYFYDRTRLRRFLVLFFVAGVVLFFTKSRSSLIAGGIAMATFAALRWPLRNIVAVGLAILVAGASFGLLDAMGAIPEAWSDVIYMGREDATSGALTGRPLIWAAAFEQFGHDNVRYLTGFGYDSFWTPLRATFVSDRLHYGISEGHDAYFDLLLSLGVIGVGCYVFVLLVSLGRATLFAFRDRRRDYAFFATILMFAVVHGITESSSVAPTFPTFFSIAAIAFLALRAPKQKADEMGWA